MEEENYFCERVDLCRALSWTVSCLEPVGRYLQTEMLMKVMLESSGPRVLVSTSAVISVIKASLRITNLTDKAYTKTSLELPTKDNF